MMPKDLLSQAPLSCGSSNAAQVGTTGTALDRSPPKFVANSAHLYMAALGVELRRAATASQSNERYRTCEELLLESSTLRMGTSRPTSMRQTKEHEQRSAPCSPTTSDSAYEGERAQRAGQLIRAGVGFKEAFQQLGIVPGPRTETLEHALLREFALPMVKNGMPVRDVYRHLGVQEGPAISRFELGVLRELGIPRVQAGGSFRDVRTELGIPAGRVATAVSKELLAELGLPRVDNGEDWGVIARDLGIDEWIRPPSAASRLRPLNPDFIGNAQSNANSQPRNPSATPPG